MDVSIQNPILLINKPSGPTSHDIVARIRKATGVKRVGHAGTLDPFAEGLLIVLVGRDATKRQAEFLGMDKTYEAVIHFGATSTTDDRTGEITFLCHSRVGSLPTSVRGNPEKGSEDAGGLDPGLRRDDKLCNSTLADVTHVVSSLIGSYDQMPPTFSAKKINGKKAYELARKGQVPELKPKNITVHSIEILDYEWPLLTIRCTVSSGTYIRALARDIGSKLGCGAYVEALKRTAIGSYLLAHAVEANYHVIPA